MPLQQASWLARPPEHARHSWPRCALRISRAGATGAGGDSVLHPQRGRGYPGTSKSEVDAKMAKEGTLPHKPRPRLGPRQQGWVGTFVEGCHLLCVQGMKKSQEYGAGEAAHPSLLPYFPPSAPSHASSSLWEPGPPHPHCPIPGLAESTKPAPAQSRSRRVKLPLVPLPLLTSGTSPPLPSGPCLHPQTIISEQD